ncbi:UMP kinase [Ignavibacteria bacterium CHB1]|nr:MAG: UMP kinase [Chlorobiota bacterium]MCE7952430.1 UMP kinase [Chlorobi bacterium CHB7]MDL1886547.1 UMP kinase [Ignavibacteria bacterium CHB1]OQY77353.1 MAG: UMP kinase [Ignavibacteriales bacterium UTCHB1]RIK49065.1 MAG: UMP kinase [Ignavibacteriota bacterium]
MKYKRILLKLSGESLMGSQNFGIDADFLEHLSTEIQAVAELNVQIGIVIGGGNIYRGLSASKQGIDRVTGDLMGMLATVINSLALQNALERKNLFTRVQSAIMMDEVAEPFILRRARRHLEKNRIVIFSAGTGSPYFTTDTAAALRAIEINADLIIKGTRVDGVYDDDPEKNPNAKMFNQLTFADVLEKNLRVMDLTAITLCRENSLPILVFNMNKKGNLLKLIQGEKVGTIIS